MALRNAVVTGASRGIGLGLCKQLSRLDAYQTIYALCRRPSEALRALAESSNSKILVVKDIDVTNDSVGTILQSVFSSNQPDPTPIDLLIHNAGAYGPFEDFLTYNEAYESQTLENVTPERMSYTLRVNAIAPLFVTKALLPNLRARRGESNKDDNDNRKVIIITSRMGSIADNTSGGHYGYRTSKAAVNMIGKSLAQDLANDKIAVGLIHPGMVFTDFAGDTVRRQGQRNVDESVRGILQATDQINMKTTGSFFHGNYGEGVLPLKW